MRLGGPRHDARSPCVARRHHPVQAKPRIARRRDHGRQTRETLDGRHHALLYPAAGGFFHAINDEAVATQGEARQRECAR